MRLINADALKEKMYHEAFEKDSDMQKWDSGCWIRYKLFENVLREQPTIIPEPHWIPVTERLPQVGKSVMICDAYGDICIGHRTNGGYYFPDFCEDKIKDVRAWAELPEPYKEATDGRD